MEAPSASGMPHKCARISNPILWVRAAQPPEGGVARAAAGCTNMNVIEWPIGCTARSFDHGPSPVRRLLSAVPPAKVRGGSEESTRLGPCHGIRDALLNESVFMDLGSGILLARFSNAKPLRKNISRLEARLNLNPVIGDDVQRGLHAIFNFGKWHVDETCHRLIIAICKLIG
jgi:hypothetical protein